MEKEPEAGQCLQELFCNSSVTYLSSCLKKSQQSLIEATPLFTHLGYKGSLQRQRDSARRTIHRIGIPHTKVPFSDAVGKDIIDDMAVLNPLTNQPHLHTGHATFMKPLDLLTLFTTVNTQQSRSLQRGLWMMFLATSQCAEKAVVDNFIQEVS